MDHRVSKDMISSGMTPSGKKSQADLGKTQYGSAPSPNKLMDAYHSMYQDQKEQTLDEKMNPADIKKFNQMGQKASKIENKNIKREKIQNIYNKASEQGLTDDVDLLAAYRAVYEHHKKDEDGNTIPHEDDVKEGKIPAGLQAYLDKKKGKKKDDDDNGDDEKEGKKKDEKDVKEGAGLYANIHAKRKRGGKMRKKGAKGAPSAQDFANAAKTAKEDVDLFDTILNHYVSEGYDEKDVIQAMSNLTEEPISLALIGAKLAAGAAKAGAVAAKAGAVAGKAGAFAAKTGKAGLSAAGKGIVSAGKSVGSAVKGAGKGIVSAGKNVGSTVKGAASEFKTGLMTKPTPPSKITGDVMKSAPKSTPVSKAQKAGQIVRKVGTYAKNNPLETAYGVNALSNLGGGGSQQQSSNTISKTGRRTSVNASADLFDIVKGQLLDEGLSEEEIKDIMLTLTPEEILNEMGAKFPAGKGANYRETPKPNPQKKLGGRTDGTAGSYVEKPQKPEPKPGEPGSKFDAKGRKRYTGGMTPYSSENMKDT